MLKFVGNETQAINELHNATNDNSNKTKNNSYFPSEAE